MTDNPTPKDKRIEREQGDVNTTAHRRKYWERNLSDKAGRWFDEDQKYFLHQSLSTPVLNVLSRADGIYIEDLLGKQYIDMHGKGATAFREQNNVPFMIYHQDIQGGRKCSADICMKEWKWMIPVCFQFFHRPCNCLDFIPIIYTGDMDHMHLISQSS